MLGAFWKTETSPDGNENPVPGTSKKPSLYFPSDTGQNGYNCASPSLTACSTSTLHTVGLPVAARGVEIKAEFYLQEADSSA